MLELTSGRCSRNVGVEMCFWDLFLLNIASLYWTKLVFFFSEITEIGTFLNFDLFCFFQVFECQFPDKTT